MKTLEDTIYTIILLIILISAILLIHYIGESVYILYLISLAIGVVIVAVLIIYGMIKK